MHRALRLHPDSRRNAVTRIDVEVARSGPGQLSLTYVLRGQINNVALPATGTVQRQDGLWWHTCLELFVTLPGGYAEFNFAPSHAFAAYRFSGYRSGMCVLEGVIPDIATATSEDAFRMDVTLTVPDLSEEPTRIGISAVVEEVSGAIGYWALEHGTDKPDFHHAAAFALEI